MIPEMTIIDLTHTFDEHMPVYPGDPQSQLKEIAKIATEGFTDHEIHTAMHVGTHMDAPLHMIEGGEYICDIPLKQCMGRGCLIDARGKNIIDADIVDPISLAESDIILVYTGFSQKFRDDTYYAEYPELSEAFAQLLIDAQILCIGMDTPSPDREPFLVHKLLLGNNVLIIENLTNLDQLLDVPSFNVIALPAKLHTNAAPTRVIATID